MAPRTSTRSIVSTAPCRADLAGGTMDIWPLYLFHPGAVTVNFALNILTTCKVTPLPGGRFEFVSLDTKRHESFLNFDAVCRAPSFRHPLAGHLVRFFRPEQGIRLETHSDSPAGAGISGSSALMIATTAALARLSGRRLSREEIRVVAQNVEAQVIKVPTGCQDYYPALYGGVSAVHLRPDGIHREAIPISPEEIDARFLLVYTGAPRQSGINNWEVFKAHINGDRRVFCNFDAIARVAGDMLHALIEADWNSVARLLRGEWKLRKSNAPGITTPLIEKLVSGAMRNGARAAKVCGAGGGGCVLFFVEEGEKERVGDVICRLGGRVLPFQVARDGLAVRGSL